MLTLNRKEKPISTFIENVCAQLQFHKNRLPVPPAKTNHLSCHRGLPATTTLPYIKVENISLGAQRKRKKAASAHAIKVLAAQRKRHNKKRAAHFFSLHKQSKNQDFIYIQSTHNNTIYTLTNSNGAARGWVSAGTCGFKNSRKATSYASQGAAAKCAALAKNNNVHRVNLKIIGLGPGRLSGVRTLYQAGLIIGKIWECTNLPHNGCRPANRRRV